MTAEFVLTSQSLTLPGRGGPCNLAGRASRSLDPNWTARYWCTGPLLDAAAAAVDCGRVVYHVRTLVEG